MPESVASSCRVVVTGAGCVTPLGSEVETVWQRMVAGQSGVGPISLFDASRFPVRIAAEVRDWDMSDVGEDPARWNRYPRQTQFVTAAAMKAVQSAGLADASTPPHRIGVSLGCGETFPRLIELGRSIGRAFQTDKTEGKGKPVSQADREEAFCMEAFLDDVVASWTDGWEVDRDPDLAISLVAAMCGAQGPIANTITGCASSTQSIGYATNLLRQGKADVMLAGGSHSLIHPIGISGLYRLGVLSTSNERGAQAMRPFDRERNGFVAGESGAVLVLETLEHAKARGANIWGEITGYGFGHDAYRITDAHPEGRGLADCIRHAMIEARLNVEEIDYINAHGTSTSLNDRTETVSLKAAFGEQAYNIPISSTKSMIGHSTTACGATEAIVALLAIRDGVIPPTINYEYPDPACDLDCVPNEARQQPCQHVLSTNLGFGGQVAAMIFSRY